MQTVTLTEYYARAGSIFTDRDAKIIGPVLDELAQRGDMTAARIVDEARPEESPIHPYFEWNDEKAAERYRENQARQMAGSIVVERETVRGEKTRVQKFVHVHISPVEREALGLDYTSQSPYVEIERVISDAERIEQKKEEARRLLIHWKQTYAMWAACSEEFYEFYQPVFDAIGQVETEDSEK